MDLIRHGQAEQDNCPSFQPLVYCLSEPAEPFGEIPFSINERKRDLNEKNIHWLYRSVISRAGLRFFRTHA